MDAALASFALGGKQRFACGCSDSVMSEARIRNLRDARSAGPVGSWRCEASVCVSQVGRGWRRRVDVK